ncbi:LacI family DNA-binding transcriptional regulator [Zafaria sp. Z1313]|uniref:LacI family DNA-binding transcriptional regulator n=1 Tax=unclassified Zafaria TaxID=2828765 RepID=UPI002E7924FA|nr:LacI family DNA-binding transcriptional regulator [Zafaria sp. J156]MEE1621796.1 LacI family DNA-binding transcriptional regulator [Zafaria sp. J156]
MTEQQRKARRKGSAATIYDIAEAAGVNASTVSRALAKPGRVKAETAERVREAARRLDYRPNPMARALPTGRMNAVGLIVSDLANPVFFDIVGGAQGAAALAGSTLLLASSQEDPEQELVAAQRLAASADGLVLATSRMDDDDIHRLAESTPVVVVNRDVPGIASIVADPRPGLAASLGHLHGLGHRRVAYVEGPGRSWINHRRRAVLEEAAAGLGIALVATCSREPTLAAGRAALPDVLATGATAVVAYNDLLALGLLQRCQEERVAVPGRLSIVGVDDIFGSELSSPRLTTVRSPLRAAGDAAARWLLDRIGGDDAGAPLAPPAHLATELVVRGSTGAAPPP